MVANKLLKYLVEETWPKVKLYFIGEHYGHVPLVTIISEIIASLWLMLPAYIPNPAAVLFKGKVPMDFGKIFLDGRRILGRGKTWRGFFGGAVTGFITGLIQNFIAGYLPASYFPRFGEGLQLIGVLLCLSFGAMSGDVLGSFIKRRMGIESGGKAFLLDQLGFVLVAWLFLLLLYPSWFMAHFGKIIPVLTILVITPALHRVVNIIGYKMGKKEVPW